MDNLKKTIIEVAENNDMGLVAYVYKDSLQIIALPGDRWDTSDTEIQLASEHKEVDENIRSMIIIEPPSSRESFMIMESFVRNLHESPLKHELAEALDRKNPFRNFNYIIHNSTYRENWFTHKKTELEDRAKQELEYGLQDLNPEP